MLGSRENPSVTTDALLDGAVLSVCTARVCVHAGTLGMLVHMFMCGDAPVPGKAERWLTSSFVIWVEQREGRKAFALSRDRTAETELGTGAQWLVLPPGTSASRAHHTAFTGRSRPRYIFQSLRSCLDDLQEPLSSQSLERKEEPVAGAAGLGDRGQHALGLSPLGDRLLQGARGQES